MPTYKLNGSLNADLYFANVKSYGAKGDGTTDDATAIQSALDALSTTGGTIYFPPGVYLIKTAVLFYSNQTLYFDGATLKQGAAINNLLRSYSESTWTGYTGVHDVLIYGGTFDGGAYTENNTLVAFAHTKNVTVENCTFKNAYGSWHDLEVNSSYNAKVINCDFEGSRKTGDTGELIQIDAVISEAGYPWSGTSIDNTACKYVEISGCIFHDCTIAPAIGNHASEAHKSIRIHDCVFDGLTSSRGAINIQSTAEDIDIYNNVFSGCTKCVASGGSAYYIHDNRFISATTAIGGSGSVSHANMINGTYTE